MSARSLARRDVLALILAAAAWGLGTVVSKRAVAEIPPVTLLPIQLASSLAVLVVLMRRRGLALGGSPVLLGRLGILNPGIAYALSIVGLTWISASLSVLLWAAEPLLILVLAAALLGERITGMFIVLSATAFAGLAIVTYGPAVEGQLLGVVLTVAGVVCCAVYTVIVRRGVREADSTAQVVLAQQAHALGFAVLLLGAAALLGGAVLPTALSAAGIASAILSGVLYYAAAYWFYLTALRTIPASLAAVSFYLIPIFGVTGAFILLGDRLDPVQWFGVAIVLLAVMGIIVRPARTPLAATAITR